MYSDANVRAPYVWWVGVISEPNIADSLLAETPHRPPASCKCPPCSLLGTAVLLLALPLREWLSRLPSIRQQCDLLAFEEKPPFCRIPSCHRRCGLMIRKLCFG